MRIRQLLLINGKHFFFPGQRYLPERGHVSKLLKFDDFEVFEEGSQVMFCYAWRKGNSNDRCAFLWQIIKNQLQRIFPPGDFNPDDYNIFNLHVFGFEQFNLHLQPLTLEDIQSQQIFSKVFTGYDLENLNEYYYNGLLEIIKPLFLREVSTDSSFKKNSVYDEEIFREHLKYVKEISRADNLKSVVERCVEKGWLSRLQLLFTNLNYLLSLLKTGDILDKHLLLRKCDAVVYVEAKKKGFYDRELEKRIVMIQRLWRKQSLSKPLTYEGPFPEDYPESRYWGYRQVSYFVKWNRHHRYLILKDETNLDCRYDAYIDNVEMGENEERDSNIKRQQRWLY
jgi:hypothetical protein